MEAIGTNGRFVVQGDKLVISRKGAGIFTAMNLGLQGDKVIPLSQITAVEYKVPGWMAGYLRLSINGRDPIGGVAEATRDENALLIDKKGAAAAKALHLWLIDNIGHKPPPASISTADEIEKLAALRDRGILTEEEFTQKKRQILGI